MKFISSIFPNVIFLREDLFNSIWQTAVMVGISGFLGLFFGMILGTVLVVTAKGGLYENLVFNDVLGKIINTVRSIPFVVLIALLVPFTRFIVGTSIGVTGAIVPEGAAREVELKMGTEDFGVYRQIAPAFFVFAGSGGEYNHHHEKFDVDENVLPVCAALHTAFVLKFLAGNHNIRRQ